jgi:hypothetical protein
MCIKIQWSLTVPPTELTFAGIYTLAAFLCFTSWRLLRKVCVHRILSSLSSHSASRSAIKSSSPRMTWSLLCFTELRVRCSLMSRCEYACITSPLYQCSLASDWSVSGMRRCWLLGCTIHRVALYACWTIQFLSWPTYFSAISSLVFLRFDGGPRATSSVCLSGLLCCAWWLVGTGGSACLRFLGALFFFPLFLSCFSNLTRLLTLLFPSSSPSLSADWLSGSYGTRASFSLGFTNAMCYCSSSPN